MGRRSETCLDGEQEWEGRLCVRHLLPSFPTVTEPLGIPVWGKWLPWELAQNQEQHQPAQCDLYWEAGLGVLEPWAGSRVGWELRRTGEEGLGRYLAESSLPSLSKPATPSHQTLFRAQASPRLYPWQSSHLGKLEGGAGCSLSPSREPALSMPARPKRTHLRMSVTGKKGGGEGTREGKSVPLRRKHQRVEGRFPHPLVLEAGG